jgi:transcriptional regulator with XRE-family HTH domain
MISLLKYHRERKGWSKSHLGYISGVSPSYIGRIETGERKPARSTVEKLISVLDMTWSVKQQVLLAVQHVLTCASLTREQREDFRLVVELIAERWLTGKPTPVKPK